MALNFPDSPADGDKFVDATTGESWTYEASTNSWTSDGLTTSAGIVYKGGIDITAAPPAGAASGWQYTVTTGGTANAGFTGLSGSIPVGTTVLFDGTNWQKAGAGVVWVRSGTTISQATNGDNVFLKSSSGTDNIKLNADGSATFDGDVKIGGTLPASPNVALGYSGSPLVIVGDYALGNNTDWCIVDGRAGGLGGFVTSKKAGTTTPAFRAGMAGTDTFTVKYDGSATFAGTVQVGAYDGASTTVNGARITASGQLNLQRQSGAATDNRFQILDGTTVKAGIANNGSATFAGDVTTGAYGTNTSGSRLFGTYGLYLEAPSAASGGILQIRGTDGTTTTTNAQIKADGSATFAGKVGIGTAAPTYLLDCKGTGTANVARFLTGSSSSGEVAQFGRSDQAVNLSIDYDGAGSMGIGTTTSHPFNLKTGAVTRATIDTAGRLLVGTTSEITSLSPSIQTARSGGAVLAFGRDDTSIADDALLGASQFYGKHGGTWGLSAFIKASADGAWGTSSYPSKFGFFTAPSGSTTPVEHLRLSAYGLQSSFSTDQVFDVRTALAPSASTSVMRIFNGSTDINTGGTNCTRIQTNGDLQNTNNSYTGISDIKLKENIVDAKSQWDDIKGLRVVNYNFKPETGAETYKQLGLIAQEVEQVCPGLVGETKDTETVEVPVLDADGNPVLDEDGKPQVATEERETGEVTKNVNYSILYMKAVGALQEAMTRIEQLEAKVTALESK